MNEISNINLYNTRMAKSMLDKLFFLDMAVGVEKMLDFGCADGTLLQYVKMFCPDMKLFGYDMSEEMVKIATEKNSDAKFYSNFEFSRDTIFQEGKENSLLNLSSIIHEVYSYSSATEIDTFWERVFYSGFKYIAVRDMMTNETANRTTPMRDEMRVRTKRSVEKQLEDFEKIFGTIANNKNFLHFLLKYKYVENWGRELYENYLPISTTRFFKMMPDTYEVVFYSSYTLPYLAYTVKEDFGIELADNTHVKILLRRKQ